MCLELHNIRVHELLSAERALRRNQLPEICAVNQLTSDVGFGALTGLPFGLTAALVPAASAFFCSR